MEPAPKKRFTIRELFGDPTQRAVAAHLGVDPSIVNRWVQGRTIPNGYNLQRLAQFFGISADDIDLLPDETRDRLQHKRLRSAETTRVG